ncbi:moxd1-like protein 1 protein [Lasius niger]|uniref:Moxd1-like protein 1 protein n=1 Tax=Lasius niger TaxID=67767 RepID=A0A0J7NWM9_LASNI|nr:moxd1-like protein 1 protein [Lasius niger]
MLLLRVIVMLIACWIVKCDLLDLYVQHMDETMRTKLYSNKRHPMYPVSRRIRRSPEDEEPLLRVGNFKKLRLDVDEEWLKQWKAKKKIIPYQNDALDYSNKREENLDPDQHEILSNATQYSKHPEETTTLSEDAAENSQALIDIETAKSTSSIINKDEIESNVSHYATIEEQKEALRDELPVVLENQTEVGKFVVEPLEFAEEIPVDDWKNSEEMENKESLQLEIISENERINPKPFDDPSSFKKMPALWENRIPKKYFPPVEKSAKNHIKDKTMTRFRRSAKDGGINRGIFNAGVPKFTRYEKLDEDGDVILEWDPSDDEEVTFRVTAKTLGYVGIGFNEKSHMMGADILLAWVDDHTGVVNLLDSHGIEMKAAPVTDTSQDVRVLGGSQNETHTTVTFARKWQTCDPQDHRLTEDTVRVLWALHPTDPELNTAIWHENRRGGKALRLKTAAAHSPPRETRNIRHWDVKLNQFEVDDTDTVYWCKIFKASSLRKKHHMIGYTPLVEKANEDLVHHVILYECASTSPILGEHARIAGARCYSPTMPRAWESCLQPVLAWARGSKGEWLPEHVGIPVAEHGDSSYYMLEVHYNNPTMKRVIDSSGVRLYLTPNLRPQEAGILVAGVAVSPLHLVPPKQKEYATAGYCTPHCTNMMFPEDGINIVSVVLHSHLAGRRLSLKHIRRGKELPRIVQDNHFDFDYQQSHTLEKEVKVLPGDELVAECVYGTLNRTKPTLGGYAATQEMCLAFVVHYPRTPLAGCYSVTPVRDLFKTLGVHSFKGVTMEYLEKLFLMNGTDLTLPSTNQQQLSAYPAGRPTDEIDKALVKEAESALRAMKDYTEESEDDNVFARLIIEEPKEFQGRTMAEHMLALPWTEELLAKSIENNLYHGRHMTFCRKRDDQLALPADIQTFPNYTALPEMNDTTCTEFKNTSGTSGISHISVINLVTIIVISIVML